MSSCSLRPTQHQPLPLSGIAAILPFDSTPCLQYLRPAVTPCRKLFSLSTFNLPTSNVPRHLTSVFSIASALFRPMELCQLLHFQGLAHSFPSQGWEDRTNARSLLPACALFGRTCPERKRRNCYE